MAGSGVMGTFKMLRAMSTERWMSARDIAKASGSPRVTTYNRLKTLGRLGIVEKSRTRLHHAGDHYRPVNLYRRTIIFEDERKKARW